MGQRWLLAGSMACAGLVLATSSWVALAQASLEPAATQSSSEHGVTVKVTAKSIGLPGSQWEFAVVLAFDVPAPRPGTIELRIERPGESVPRTFRWPL